MKDIVPPPPAIIRNDVAAIKGLFDRNVVPSYARFEIVLSHGAGSHVFDITGKRYLDFGGGIAVSALGHAHPAITEALIEQSKKLVHTSNLYFCEPQGRLAEKLVNAIGPGKIFFTNSGGEANEGLFKLARKFGHDEGRFEILTVQNSFHGRTLAGISATGQDKVKKGFEPMVPGFRHVPFNDLEAMRKAISPATVAIMIECVQGEGGITSATPEYLLGLRKLCDERKLLLLLDSVQDGHFRTGRCQAFQRIFENERAASILLAERGDVAKNCQQDAGSTFLPDGISMAKSLGAGFPIGAFWVRQPFADLLSAGSHGSTYGGGPLACAVALKVFEVIEREKLAENARNVGEFLKGELLRLAERFPQIIKTARGLGFIIGLELAEKIPTFSGSEKSHAIQFVNRLHEAGMLAIPSGTQVIRLLPPLNLRRDEAEQGIRIIESVAASLNA
ncbi:MAG: aminotransferase class III-fold pyridoxal phosphate-dependent enzyme [Verrucomicrobiota bacterium]